MPASSSVVTAVRPTSLGGTALDLHVEYLDGDDRWEMDDDVLLVALSNGYITNVDFGSMVRMRNVGRRRLLTWTQ